MAFTGRLKASRSLGKLGLATALIVGACVSWFAEARDESGAFARHAPRIESVGNASVPIEALPPEARTTTKLIRQGGPFPYRKDGVAFGNRERQLPARHRGYYREYTVRTPGAKDRGAQRIVCGGPKPTAPEACYYTADHYASFKLIAQ